MFDGSCDCWVTWFIVCYGVLNSLGCVFAICVDLIVLSLIVG